MCIGSNAVCVYVVIVFNNWWPIKAVARIIKAFCPREWPLNDDVHGQKWVDINVPLIVKSKKKGALLYLSPIFLVRPSSSLCVDQWIFLDSLEDAIKLKYDPPLIASCCVSKTTLAWPTISGFGQRTSWECVLGSDSHRSSLKGALLQMTMQALQTKGGPRRVGPNAHSTLTNGPWPL